MSRVLVTGASGFIGRNAPALLAERGLEVHAVSTREQPRTSSVSAWHRADLLEEGAREELIDRVSPDHLLHFAWYAEPGRYWTSPENVRWVEASLALLRAFQANGGRRAVLAGTCAEYDWGHGLMSEATTPLGPTTLYGRSKNALRDVAEAFAEEVGLRLAWGRIFFLYGPGEHPDRLVASVARALLGGVEAPTSEGSQVRDFMHVEDVARAFVELLVSDVDGAVNIASGRPVAVRDVVDAVGAAAGRPELIRAGELPARAGEPPSIVGDAGRLRDEVGFTPRFSLDEGIAQTVDWWRRAA